MDIFAFIKSRVSILTVVQEYVALKRAGLYWKGRCPFHNEKTASFTVSPHREIFYCFGCHKGGDVVSFIAELEHQTPIEAAKYLADRYQIEIPAPLLSKAEGNKSVDSFQRYSSLCKLFAQWCNQQLLVHPVALDYVTARGMAPSIAPFDIGYFPEHAFNKFLEYAKSEGFMARDLIEAHIIQEGKFGLYSSFSERIIFPIRDHLGRTCGFGGRVFKPNDDRAKYYNSHDHTFFSKGSILFGLDKAKKAIQAADAVFLVEGYVDCIAMVQAGYANTVATLGTACTAEHLNVLSRYAQHLHVMYDGDAAGREAVIKLVQLAWTAGMEVDVVSLPQSEDPASYLYTHKHLDAVLPKAQDIFTFFLNYLGEQYHRSSMQERLELVQEIVQAVGLVEDGFKRSLLLQQASLSLGIPMEILGEFMTKVKLKQARSGEKQMQEQPVVRAQSTQTTIDPFEKMLFITLIQRKTALSPDDEALILRTTHDVIHLLFDKLLIYNKSSEHFNSTDFLALLEPHEQAVAVKMMIESDCVQEQPVELMIKALWKREWKSVAQNLKMRLQEAERSNDYEHVKQISESLVSIKNTLRDKGIL
jgi:DNA primase